MSRRQGRRQGIDTKREADLAHRESAVKAMKSWFATSRKRFASAAQNPEISRRLMVEAIPSGQVIGLANDFDGLIALLRQRQPDVQAAPLRSGSVLRCRHPTW